MLRWLTAIALVSAALAVDPAYEVDGRLTPAGRAIIFFQAGTNSLARNVETDAAGAFRLKKMLAGTYVVRVMMPGRGEANLSVDLGPAQADARGRIKISLNLSDSDFEFAEAARRSSSVSAAELAIPNSAWREFEGATRELEKPDPDSARARLEKAVKIAPKFGAAWNTLGTIAYQKREYPQAETCFRTALDAEPGSFTPLVNLGGVLINLGKLDEALTYNRRAVLMQPKSVLANSQLGLTYLQLGQLEAAVKYLEIARSLDPGHFTAPQLNLAQAYAGLGERGKAAGVLEEFLERHPNYASAAELRKTIESLRR